MPGKILKKLFRKKPKGKVKKGIDPKTGYRYGYKPHYLSKGENISLGVGIGGSIATPLIVREAKKRAQNKENKKKKQFGGAIGPNGIL